MLYWGYDYTMIILLPAILLTVWAQAKVKSTFRRYSEIRNSTGLTGAMAARRVLDASGLNDVTIHRVAGSLTDYYDPRTRSLHLSDDVYGADSIAAVGVACHEAGHAVQHARHYVPLIVRNIILTCICILTEQDRCRCLRWSFIPMPAFRGTESAPRRFRKDSWTARRCASAQQVTGSGLSDSDTVRVFRIIW